MSKTQCSDILRRIAMATTFFFLHILGRSLANCMLIDIVLLPLFEGFEHEINTIRLELLKNASLYLYNCKFVKKIYLLNIR